jgi:hypothetical protein
MNKNSSSKFTGRCMCNAVTYEVTGSPVIVAQCHCDECRRLSGTGHSIGAMFAKEQVVLTGELSEFKYNSDMGSEVTKAFCGICGSPIYGTNTRSPDHLTLTLGSIDDAKDLEIQVVIFERDKKHCDQLGEDVMSFETQPDWKPSG